MMFISKSHKSRTLSAQIRAAEQRVSDRQRQIAVHATTITQKVERQMSQPPNLLLAGGIGFILGEVTQKAPVMTCKNGDATPPAPLKIAMNLLASLQAVYAFLPLALLVITALESKPAQAESGLKETNKNR